MISGAWTMGTGGFVGVVLLLGVVAALLTDRSASGSRIAKMAASSLVLLVAIIGVTDTTWAYFVIGALALSWIGDLALSFTGDRWFLVGLVSFAGAHLFYVVAFGVRGSLSMTWLLAGALLMAVVGTGVLRWLAPHRPPEMATPLLIYVVIIGAMVAFAFATHGGWPDWRIPVAAVSFAASDILVARQQFVTRGLVNRVVGLPLYFLAQALFAIVVDLPSLGPAILESVP